MNSRHAKRPKVQLRSAERPVRARPASRSIRRMDLVKGATILAARIAEAKRRREAQLEWTPEEAEREGQRCVVCGGAIADVLASLGSLRCHDCRGSVPQR